MGLQGYTGYYRGYSKNNMNNIVINYASKGVASGDQGLQEVTMS